MVNGSHGLTNVEDLKALLDSVFDIIVCADKNGKYLYFSQSAEDFYDMSEEDFLETNVHEVHDKKLFFPSAIMQTLNTRREGTFLQKTITGKTLIIKSTPIFDDSGEMERVVTIGKDITELEAMKAELMNTRQYLSVIVDEQTSSDENYVHHVESVDQKMVKAVEVIKHVAQFDTTISLLGETGVGKSYYAKMIHDLSSRKDKVFVHINCGAIPSNLFESELFGYEQGAFTGASVKGKKGLLELAKDGTVFLDEISELPLDMQVKLLHVLEERKFMRVGGATPIPVNSRFITATNKDLAVMAEEGTFREDLYYRINVVPITILPLRERHEDIVNFANRLIEVKCEKYKIEKELTEEAMDTLVRYDWPGNIRQMENVVERLIVTTLDTAIGVADVRAVLNGGDQASQLGGGRQVPATGEFFTPDEDIPIKEQLADYERAIIKHALSKYMTTRKAAKSLGIDQSTLVKKMKRLGI